MAKKSNTKYIIPIVFLSILVVGLVVSTICLAFVAATAYEKVDYLQEKVDKLEANNDDDDDDDGDFPGDFVVKKPLIYLYPTSDTEVSVKLSNSNKLSTSYPKYDDGWKVFAKKDGNLIDKNTGRSLYGLYWEGENYPAKRSNEGFVVAGKDSAKFLEEKLAALGLTEREANEMIIYWLPQLEVNAYNYIRFDLNETMDKYMPLNISPKPDTVIRVSMVFEGLEKPISVREQKITTPERNGFTVVEWGGSEIK